MILKKIHNVENGKSLGIAGIEVKFAPKAVKHLSQRFIDDGMTEGWLTLGAGKMSIAGVDGAPVLELHVLRVPGHYCCHCEEKLPSDPAVKPDGMTEGQRHVKANHPDTPSPDSTNPAGYRWETFYTVVNPGDDTMTKNDAVAFEKQHRQAFHDRIHKSMRAAKKAG